MTDARVADEVTGGRIAAMATQRPRKAETSSPPRRSARAKLLVRAEDRGFEPRRAARPNRISSAFPLVTGRSGNHRDRPEWQASRAGNAGIVPGLPADARRVRTRNGHTHTTEMPVIAGPLPWPGVYRRCGRSWSAPCRPAGELRSCSGPHRSRPGRTPPVTGKTSAYGPAESGSRVHLVIHYQRGCQIACSVLPAISAH